MLYGYDEAFAQNDRLVITEGFFDKLRTGVTAVATLGKSISDEQLRLIRLGDFKEVIVFLDQDAQRESRAIAHKLSLYFKTYICCPTAKDPGEMTTAEIQHVLQYRKERVY